MEPTSAAQFEAYQRNTVPELEQVRDDIWAVGLRLGRTVRPLYTLSYLLRDAGGGIHVIDPGVDGDANWQRLVVALGGIGATPGDVRQVIATHRHTDHAGLAARLRDLGADFVVHADEPPMQSDEAYFDAAGVRTVFRGWGMPRSVALRYAALTAAITPLARRMIHDVDPDILVRDGDTLDVPGFHLEVLATPGHTPGHISLVETERDVVFTGDQILPNQYPAIGAFPKGDDRNPLAVYLETLGRLPDGPEGLPGHGYRFRSLGERVEQTARHHLRRSREVAAVLARDPEATVWEIAPQLSWTAGWKKLRGYYRISALRQTALHRDYVLSGAKVPAEGESWR